MDATFGRGGHSRELLKALGPSGRLIIFDQDSEAIAYARQYFGQDPRVCICEKNFEALEDSLQQLGIIEVDGILFDLGVSSPQLDAAERGFSFLRSGPLDMRMNNKEGQSCAEVLQNLDVGALTKIIKDYGEERFAGNIARSIVAARSLQPLTTTEELASLIAAAIPKRLHEKHKHPATRTFQALRIYLNRELEVLQSTLTVVPKLLALGGRAVFISFHSLEDRLVKQAFHKLCTPPPIPKGLPIKQQEEDLPRFKLYIKMQKASVEEISNNVRARSAVLRVMERLF